jgi:hypothetical protein
MLVNSARPPFTSRITTLKVKNVMANIVVRLRADWGLFNIVFVIFIARLPAATKKRKWPVIMA